MSAALKPYRSSASQVGTAEDCLRKWGFLKIDKRHAPPNVYAAFGTRVHKLLEEWFRDGTPPPNTPEGAVARRILSHLPPPQTVGIDIERNFDIVLAGVPMTGYIDLSILARKPRPFVSDHKTTGRLPNPWMVEAETMHEDIQVSLYCYDAMLRTNAKEVDAQWTYGTRDGKKSLPVVRNDKSEHGPITYDQIKPRLEKTAATVALLRNVYEEQIPGLELPYNAAACEKYGGCPFQEVCNLSPQERIQSIMSQKTTESAFLSKLRKKKAGSNGAAAATPHPAPAEPAPDVNKPPAVPTTSGTVNPPSAPTEAKTAPPETPEEKPKKKRTRRSKKKTADKAPEAPATAPAEPKAATAPATAEKPASAPPAPAKTAPKASAPAPTPPAPAEAPSGVPMVPMSDVARMVELMVEKYRLGFADGFKAGRGES